MARHYRDCSQDARRNIELAFEYMRANMVVLKNDFKFKGLPREPERIRRRMDRKLDEIRVKCHSSSEVHCRGGRDGKYGTSHMMTHRIHICFKKFLSHRNSFCALVGTIAHEYAHIIGMQRHPGHNISDAMDPPRMFGRFVADLCREDNLDRELLPLPDPPRVPVQTRPTHGITLFPHTNSHRDSRGSTRGRGRNFIASDRDLRQIGRDDSASSLEVLDGNWEVCASRDYLGWCLEVGLNTKNPGPIINLRDFHLDNEISSLRPIVIPRTGLTLYRDRGLQGLSHNFTQADRDLSQMGLNEKASSLEVHTGRWEVCRKKDFEDPVTVDSNVDDLRTIGLNHRITSLRPI